MIHLDDIDRIHDKLTTEIERLVEENDNLKNEIKALENDLEIEVDRRRTLVGEIAELLSDYND